MWDWSHSVLTSPSDSSSMLTITGQVKGQYEGFYSHSHVGRGLKSAIEMIQSYQEKVRKMLCQKKLGIFSSGQEI